MMNNVMLFIIMLGLFVQFAGDKMPGFLKKNKELCPIYCGVAFLDQCKQLENLVSIKFYNVNYPLLILPFISRASEILGKKILVQFNNTSFLINYNLINVKIHWFYNPFNKTIFLGPIA